MRPFFWTVDLEQCFDDSPGRLDQSDFSRLYAARGGSDHQQRKSAPAKLLADNHWSGCCQSRTRAVAYAFLRNRTTAVRMTAPKMATAIV